jgi:hypothetical protein
LRVATLGACLLAASAAAAQQVEVSPFGGYRFGWGVANVEGVPVVDDDGGPSFGAVVDIPLGPHYEGMVFEALFSRERARVSIQPSFGAPPTAIVEVDHLLIGVSQELDGSSPRARAFISGLVGLTRYAAASDNDLRFTIGLGAGGKFFATRHLGLRLEARGYMTFVNLSGVAVCSGGCAVAFAYNPVFQADVTAGLIIAF